ncbi:MAG: RidA family protein [Gemmatimonadales bacterium]|nr:MAG: RidA family protein [Gemmatimonadales bacterium]
MTTEADSGDFRVLQPQAWGRPRGYANGIVARGRLVTLAGMIGWNPVEQRFETDDFVGQVEQALRNILTVLEEADARPEHIVRLTWFVTNRDEYLESLPQLGESYRAVMGTHYPAMTVVAVSALVEAEAKVEIEATAVTPD